MNNPVHVRETRLFGTVDVINDSALAAIVTTYPQSLKLHIRTTWNIATELVLNRQCYLPKSTPGSCSFSLHTTMLSAESSTDIPWGNLCISSLFTYNLDLSPKRTLFFKVFSFSYPDPTALYLSSFATMLTKKSTHCPISKSSKLHFGVVQTWIAFIWRMSLRERFSWHVRSLRYRVYSEPKIILHWVCLRQTMGNTSLSGIVLS
jgi:hypothetical protein